MSQQLTKKSLIDFYLDFINNYLTFEKMAEDYKMELEDLKTLLRMGAKFHNELVSAR